ncbi:MAG: hypothetical protein LCH39_11770 [Proteobacteria bacterium]|nr:hypothetical protein [Pseudomonadota bacterium]
MVRQSFAALLLLPLLAVPAFAQQPAPRPLEGRYALHREACAGNAILIQRDLFEVGNAVSCKKPVYRRQRVGPGDRALWNVSSRECQLHSGGVHALDFSIEARGSSVRVVWSDSEMSDFYSRCGK